MKNQKEINVFKILTSYFNTNLNDFIVECHQSKEEGRRYTGGLMDIVSHKPHQYYHLADELVNIRGEIFSTSNQIEYADATAVEQILNRLFNIYYLAIEDAKRSQKAEGALEPMLLLPMRKMFFELDQDLGSDSLKEKINQMHLKYAGVLFKIKKFILIASPEKKEESIRKKVAPLWKFRKPKTSKN